MLTTTYESVCSGKHTVNATAFDEDVSPNGAPFTFTVVAEGTRGKWEIEHINGKNSTGTFTVLSECIHTPGLFHIFGCYSLNVKWIKLLFMCHWPTYNTVPHNVKVELCFSKFVQMN
jgi:hypothetical protein